MEGQLNKFLTIGGSTILTFSDRDGRGPRFTDAIKLSPIVPAYDSLGNYIYQPNFANPRKSPLAYVEDVDKERSTRIFTMLYAQLQIKFRSGPESQEGGVHVSAEGAQGGIHQVGSRPGI
jgi:hypothetical protein